MKDYILDDGKIRNCSYNIRQMGVLEYIYRMDKWSIFTNIFTLLLNGIRNAFSGIFYIFVSIAYFIIWPILIILRAQKAIKNSKRD